MVFFKVTKRCIRCRKPERNDGTEENPNWVCDNPKCSRYTPKETVEKPAAPGE